MEKTIYQKLADVRVAVQKRAIKKSGKNKFAGFDYFELKDFLTISNEEMAKEGLCPVFSIFPDQSGNENTPSCKGYGSLTIYDGKDSIVFTMPTADATTKGQLPIQALGSLNTYCKRYLYMNALELAEDDSIDATTGKEEKKESYASEMQIALIESGCTPVQLANIREHFKVNNLKELTVKQASDILSKMEKGKNERTNN